MFLLMIGLFFFLLMIFIVLAVGIIFFVKNKVNFYPQYETFAVENHYKYTQAMGRKDLKIYDEKAIDLIGVQIVVNPYVRQYGDFLSYPFGRGTYRWVMFLIEGNYMGTYFRAFTYHFRKCVSDSMMDRAGYFGIVMIPCEGVIGALPENTFLEKNMLCQYAEGYLDVSKIHGTIDNLLKIE